MPQQIVTQIRFLKNRVRSCFYFKSVVSLRCTTTFFSYPSRNMAPDVPRGHIHINLVLPKLRAGRSSVILNRNPPNQPPCWLARSAPASWLGLFETGVRLNHEHGHVRATYDLVSHISEVPSAESRPSTAGDHNEVRFLVLGEP